MKKFNIPKLEKQFDIGALLSTYAESLKKDSNGDLEASISVDITSDKLIVYYFNVRCTSVKDFLGLQSKYSFPLFNITLFDFENASLFVKSFEGSEHFALKIKDLEAKIDEFISSETTGVVLGYLIQSGLILNEHNRL